MKLKLNNIKVKLLIAIFTSAGLASLFLLILSIIFIIASASMKFAIFFNQHLFEFMLLFFFIFVTLTIIFFLMLIKSKVKYLEEITSALEHISSGNLNIIIPVKTTDELGEMARTVNVMASKLKHSIEEERRLEKEKSNLMTNMSHDLRTPLTSTLGYLDLVNNMDLKNENATEYVSIAYDKCQELKLFIDDLFEYSKLQNASVVANITKVDLKQLIEQTVIGFIPALQDTGIEYRLFFSKEKLVAYVDPILLARVLDNLINNAILYGKDGKYLDITLERNNGAAVIRVINYNNQISQTDLPYVFDRFYKGNRKTSSGLGLSIVKRIVEMHEGSVDVHSDKDKTTFEVKLQIS